ncbi:septation protein A [Sphingomonas donggukensis]|uniref:Inner membrane-spanning protein YciB n=1 Tax=Sphingomonas donggukensis TaxID=2949093 RepID=A0ABY4TXM0_9SPHN|nr:septation protein A [Sphingomonas donggukensis]URW76734.1 septation protein A [Sphingomonas donggukensis]
MTAPKPPNPAPSAGLRAAIDYGPLLVFFAVNFFAPGPALARIMAATIAFMVAMVVAVVVSWVKTRHVSPMLWISAVLILVFGGLTLYFHDERFIKMKPTFVYALFAGVLGFGLATGRPLLQALLGSAYPGLSENGWRKLTVNWTVFFAAMAVLNEVVWRSTTTDQWVFFKFPGCAIITVVFALANIPMLLKHGLTLGDTDETPVPPEG